MKNVGLICAGLLFGAAPLVYSAANASAAGGTDSRFEAEVSAAKGAMMTDPSAALVHARDAVKVSATLPSQMERVLAKLTGRWLEGEALMRVNRPLEAKPVIEAALDEVARVQPRSKLHADLLKARAGAALLTGDPQTALEDLIAAHRFYARLREPRSQAIVLQNIGSIYQEARDFERALKYYGRAAEVFTEDPALAIANHNNRGNALKELGKFTEAEAEFQAALRIAREINSSTLEARILTNVAAAQVAAGKLSEAERTAERGLQLATGPDAAWQPFLWGVKAQVALAKRDYSAAKAHIERTFAGLDLATSALPFRDFHDTAQRIYRALGQSGPALEHLAAFARLDSEAREVAATTSSALMAAQFDAANQEASIAKLKSEQLARDKQIQQAQHRTEKFILAAILGAAALLVILGAVFASLVTIRRSRDKVNAANVQLTHAARHDALTGLPNRSYLRELLGGRLESGETTSERCSLLLIDLDRFKEVNDTLGHWAGDELLRQVGLRLGDLLPGGSYPARLGGDEFGAMVPFTDRPSLTALGARIVEAIEAPFMVGGSQVTVGASIGIAISVVDGNTVDVLTRNADLALYRSKQTGRGKFSFYEPELAAEADRQQQLKSDLRSALGDDQLSLMYQPILEVPSGRVVAYEALLRWDHPTRGAISPDEFILIAEEAGIIRQIGDWVIRSACQQAVNWPDDVKVAINLSAVQVEAEGLVATVLGALASTGLQPHRLEFEVTETVFLRQGERTKATLDQLRSLGVSLALDDFGTGYSSLGYLQRAEFSKIKIDRSFVKSAAEGCRESVAIIQAIVSIAQSLGMSTTAEGIETDQEKALLTSLGCSQLQGFLLGRPATQERAAERMVA
jgi:diguanylate cyclase (GGDEF)-like protein